MEQYRLATTTVPAQGAATDTERFPLTSMVVPARNAAPERAATVSASVSEALVAALADLGVEHAFAVFGGAIAPFCEALSRSSITLVHCRHESGAAFAAIEASLSSGRPVVVVSTAGPGATNLVTGMMAARWEGARVVFISGSTAAAQRGKWAFQDGTAAGTPHVDLYRPGTLFHHAQIVEDYRELPSVLARLRNGMARPNGFVMHLGLPVSLQVARAERAPTPTTSCIPSRQCDPSTLADCVARLSQAPFVIWAGFGARHAADEVRELAERARAMVMCSPRAKGIVSEEDPLFLGVTGLGGYGSIERHLGEVRPKHLLVLGTRLGEMTSFWDERLVPSNGFIHVDLEADVFGTAFPGVPTLGIQAEVGAFLRQLLNVWPDVSRVECRPTVRPPSRSTSAPRTFGPVRPSYLMQMIQREIVEGSPALVLTEAGNSFSFGTHYLRFAEPQRYRTSTGFGSMGHVSSGVIGAALGSRHKAVAIVGDGAMLMQNELNTAASYGIAALWIVLNDARYGMIDQGMRSLGWQPFETEFARADFVAIARGMGADGIRAEREADLAAALRLGMQAPGPFVVDVVVDPNELAPGGRRNQSLRQQGVGKA
ncbi:MAG: thiamine pyrophosphate-binding protein [Polyangiaceae bacterium]|nr:thiamine pyrophosphate-binding protein [Polyangiaceae bacterium]